MHGDLPSLRPTMGPTSTQGSEAQFLQRIATIVPEYRRIAKDLTFTPKEGTGAHGEQGILAANEGGHMDDPEEKAPAEEREAAAESAPHGTAAEAPAEPVAQPSAAEVEQALENAFADVRTQSADSALVTPERWEAAQIAPAGMDPAVFAQLVFDVIDANAKRAADAQDDAPEENAAAEADAAAAFGGDADLETEGGAAEAAPGAQADQADAPAGADGASAEGEEVPSLPGQVLAALAAGTSKSRYLYSTDFMTDSFAHWSYLALEDDKVATFVDIVREESRVYPRPMVYRALLNDPFDMTEDEVLDCWKTVQESEKFPDIASCSASNDDVYFYSTDYLSAAQAKALAEYYSVERWMNP